MRTLKKLLALLIVFSTVQVMAQTDKATTTRLVADKHLVFNATAAIPMANADLNKVLSRMPGGTGGVIQLNGSQYQLKIDKDSVEAFLPYYGRAYTATMNSDDAGIKFKSKKFDYKTTTKKKGGWIIEIKPKDTKDVRSLTLSLSPSGYASLNVNSTNRQSITFNGVISEPVVKEE
ncbi:DUF4251 domain-containing protein [Pedobacter gandavensis]|uniref:DUF4251 domain-containing protein n=1 Tax=Pedobacter gandavensis TaxID=2679963 RepID=A0ABR6F337_9SPHI|nr:DUF4251 domain-containing protein [Pedobacter gandavensis]MBB2151108.1 DUF4251 domain-containing protein [Pedobacter gandavensis]